MITECNSCLGYGYFDADGDPTSDRNGRKCLDCRGEGRLLDSQRTKSQHQFGYFDSIRASHPLRIGQYIEGKRVIETSFVGPESVAQFRLQGEFECRVWTADLVPSDEAPRAMTEAGVMAQRLQGLAYPDKAERAMRQQVSELENRAMAAIGELRGLKEHFPQLRNGYYDSSCGSLLNAYREGDVTFAECVLLLKKATRD